MELITAGEERLLLDNHKLVAAARDGAPPGGLPLEQDRRWPRTVDHWSLAGHLRPAMDVETIKFCEMKKDGDPKNFNSCRKVVLEEKLRRLRKIQAILELSNATPLKSKTGRGFSCVYCPKVIPEPANLKTHVLRDHSDVKAKFTYLNEMLAYEKVKLDVTALECSVCRTQVADLKCLCDHLNKTHGKALYVDNVDKFLPFKLGDPDGLRCIFCSEKFNSFYLLVRHMNIHYRNHICQECEIGFTTRASLRIHVRETHELGEHRCGSCEKVFKTMNKKKDHEKTVHLGFKRNKCPYCPERFVGYEQRNAHVQQTHGEPVAACQCNSCERSFDTQKKLNRHIRKDHLMERPHACTECDKRFFKKTCLVRHMLTHTKKRQFTCDICSKSYGRKSTLREHLRIHSNDRRFICKECPQSFVQKCSWRSHMRTRHHLLV
ncbi:Zinc finger protein 26 [Eumeta japonica]|uniref:Zinc finger protein 26 n=1 Tax=Eumeta variegata TaxID=151549 RepID=A0A4C1VY79_EUMVA|nr:Zinc finger protein 26 [Eumeta japonica]